MNTDPVSESTAGFPDLPGYRVESLISRVRSGTVYRAWHTKLHRHVAINCLSGIAPGSQVWHQFQREIAIVGQLSDPHLVRVYDVGEQEAGEQDAVHYVVLELVDGIDLSACIDQIGPLRVADACEVIRQVSQGLQEAHEHGLIHRDVNPANLMLVRDGTIKLLELGLVVFGDKDAIATGDFIAPELARGEENVSVQVDIFGLGATLFNLLTGEGPGAGDHGKIPLELAAIVKRMTAVEPSGRFAEPKDVAEALTSHCTGADLLGLSRSVGRDQDSFDWQGEFGPDEEGVGFGARRFGARQWRRSFALTACIAIAGLAAVLFLIRGSMTGGHKSESTMQIPLEPAKILMSAQHEWSEPDLVDLGQTESATTPTLTDDELTIVFARPNQLFIADRASIDDPFGDPVPISLNLQPRRWESPAISGDGLTLVFSLWMDAPGGDDANLWMCQRDARGEEFGPAVELDSLRLPQRQNGAWLDSDGKTLVFSSRHVSNKPIQMIALRSSRDELFRKADSLPVLENESIEVEPCLSSDGQVMMTTLYPIANRKERKLAMRTRQSDGSAFGDPLMVPLKRHREGSTNSAHLSADGTRLYYAASRTPKNRPWRIWMSRRVPIIPSK